MADAKLRANATAAFTRLFKTSPAWDRTHSRAAAVPEAKMPVEAFVEKMEAAMHAAFADSAAKYQAQFRELLGHLMKRPPGPNDSCFLFEAPQLAPEALATLPPSRMGSIAEMVKAEAAQKAMDEHGHISAEFSKTAGVQCPKCGKVDLSRLNLNRSGLDDERFGKQYETNMDVEDTCQCRLVSAEEQEKKDKEAREQKEKETAAVKAFASSGNFLTPDAQPTVAATKSSPALKPLDSPKRAAVGQKRSRSASKE